jgi:hypothetical protein
MMTAQFSEELSRDIEDLDFNAGAFVLLGGNRHG